MTDDRQDRLRRADTYTHWPELQAYMREQVAAEREPEPDGEIHDDDDGEIE